MQLAQGATPTSMTVDSGSTHKLYSYIRSGPVQISASVSEYTGTTFMMDTPLF